MSVDIDKSDKLIRLLDTVVIKLEGGTEEDLKELDEPPQQENAASNDKAGNGCKPLKHNLIQVLKPSVKIINLLLFF